jgi:hypothetical protein
MPLCLRQACPLVTTTEQGTELGVVGARLGRNMGQLMF